MTKRSKREPRLLLSVALGVTAVSVMDCGAEVVTETESSASTTGQGGEGSVPASSSTMCCANSFASVGPGGGIGEFGGADAAGGGGVGGAGGSS